MTERDPTIRKVAIELPTKIDVAPEETMSPRNSINALISLLNWAGKSFLIV